MDTVADRLDAETADALLGAVAVSRSGLAPADLASLLPGVGGQVRVAVFRRVLGGQLREADATGRLMFSHGVVREASALRARADMHARLVALRAADDVWDSMDALDVVWHAIASSAAGSAAALARALNQRVAGTEVTLMRALRAFPAGLDVIDALDPETLTEPGIEALLHADQVLGGDHLSALDRIRYGQRVLATARAASGTLGDRIVSWAANNLGQSLSAVGDWSGARAVFEESLALARELREAQPGLLQPVRDVSVSLDNMGAVLKAVGDWAGARAV
ncbi:tetratricopeptide repeat protein, partial [Gordonia alkaliphila]|uniref:tetratricopeptide repeat protein n=1 Tax=Gordonia alkaliphila TaxID=1053547 RepID=UPI0031EE2235